MQIINTKNIIRPRFLSKILHFPKIEPTIELCSSGLEKLEMGVKRHKNSAFARGNGGSAAEKRTKNDNEDGKMMMNGNVQPPPPMTTTAIQQQGYPQQQKQPQLGGRRQFAHEQSELRFSDMGGCEAQFLESAYLLMHLKQPEFYSQLGLNPPKGLLLHGPPGCGKSTFARAIAGELEIPMFCVSSTELVAGVSGESERKIRMLFAEAELAAPALILIDDIDVVAAKRENAQRELERRIVTQLIASLDELGTKRGGNANDYVFVIGTTSRPDVLDASLRRAGRFDKELALGIPDQRSRLEILKIATRRMRLSPEVDLLRLAQLTPGYVGADLFALVQEASTRAISYAFTAAAAAATAAIITIDGPTDEHHQNKQIDQSDQQMAEEDDGEKMRVEAITTTVATSSRSRRDMMPWRRTVDETRAELARAMSWLKAPNNSATATTTSQINAQQLRVSMADFEWALTTVHPSAKREGFATVPDVSWEDIGSLQAVRTELNWSILYPIQNPEYFEQFGAARPQGILLCGPPGCGKTLLAKAVANETGMSFISVKGPELLSMYVGESERAVRTVFQRARDSNPCVIFFDEIDALCPKRTQKENVGSARLVNQLLTEMDGLEARKKVFLIGATNRPDIVDPAILRPGRFDKVLFIDFPNAAERADILTKSTKGGTKPPISPEVSFARLAENPALEFFTGADLAALVHEASMNALKQLIEEQQQNSIVNHKMGPAKFLAPALVNNEHFEKALKQVSPSVKAEDRERYRRLREKFRHGNYHSEETTNAAAGQS